MKPSIILEEQLKNICKNYPVKTYNFAHKHIHMNIRVTGSHENSAS